MAQTYKIRTIKDIVDKVPPDRISECMEELTVLLIQASNMRSLLVTSCGVLKPDLKVGWELPEEITWVDDKAGVIENNFQMGEDRKLIVRT